MVMLCEHNTAAVPAVDDWHVVRKIAQKPAKPGYEHPPTDHEEAEWQNSQQSREIQKTHLRNS